MIRVDKISSELSSKMANMSFICACMIVMFHATPAPQPGGLTWWFCHLLGREGICMIAVPWFFFSSGFFLAGHMGESAGWWKREVVKRLRSIVVPFYVWMFIGILFGAIVWYMKARVFHMNTRDSLIEIPLEMYVLKVIGLHPMEDIGVLWYLRSLFGFVLISPLLYRSLRWKKCMMFMFSLAYIYAAWCFTNGASADFYFFFDRFFSLRGLLYFSFGMIIRNHILSLNIRKSLGVMALLVGSLLLIIDNLILDGGSFAWVGLFEAILVPFLLAGVFVFIPVKSFPRWMINNCFPIFLMHNIFLSLSSLGFKCIGMYGNQRYDIVMMLARASLAIVFSIVATETVRKFFPRASAVVFGGR